MTDWFPESGYRKTEGLGVWEHRGKVAAVGIGHSPTARRWDEKIENSLGALTMLAVQRCLDDAGLTVDEIDGIVAEPLGSGDTWAPRPYFEPPYDSEDGLSGVSADWLIKNMGFKNIKVAYHAQLCISKAMCAGAQIVGDGLADNVLVVRATGNMPGRYHHTAVETASGPGQWTNPWGWQLIPQIAYGFDQYCRKYGTNHDRMAPFVLNQRRNGLMFPEGYYYQHRPEVLTVEDYQAGRWVCKPMSIYDCDLPIQASAAYLLSTAERAKDMKQKPVYVLNHCTNDFKVRSMVETLDETEAWTDSLARKVYEGSGLTANDLDICNPYDGFTLFTQYYLEGLQWRGVKRGEAHDFYASDISVEGPNPFSSSGGNCGNGRTRWWIWTDTVQQLQGRAGQRQVRIKAENGLAGAYTPITSHWMVFSNSPD